MTNITAESLKLWGCIFSVVSNQHGKSSGRTKIDAKYFTVSKVKILQLEGIDYPNGTSAIRVNGEIDFPIGQFGPGKIAQDESSLTSKFYATQEDAESVARMLTETYLDKVASELRELSEIIANLGEIKESYESQINNSTWLD
jgi:hypothetical protein